MAETALVPNAQSPAAPARALTAAGPIAARRLARQLSGECP